MKRQLLLLGCICLPVIFFGQSVGIGTQTPAFSALLELNAPDKGLLIPRVALNSTAQAAPVTSATTGLLVYNTNTGIIGQEAAGVGFYYWTGFAWRKITASNDSWNLTGNVIIDSSKNFIGTNFGNPNQALIFKSAGQFAGRLEVANENLYFGVKAGSKTLLGNGFNFPERNTFIGNGAGLENIRASSSTYIGAAAGRSSRGGFGNTMVGAYAGAAADSSEGNTYVGAFAGGGVGQGYHNTAIGYDAGSWQTSSAANLSIGNVTVGYEAGRNLGQSAGNVAIGRAAGRADFTVDAGIGNYNVFIGDSSALVARGSNENVVIGHRAGVNLTNGSRNVMVGDSAGFNNTIGTGNVFIGDGARASANNIVNATAIGARAFAAGDNSLVLGAVQGENGATTGVNVGIGTTNPQRKLHIVDQTPAGINANANSSLVLEKNGTANYINFLNTTAESGILFGVAGAPAGAANGGILYNNPSFRQGLNFRTGGNVNRMVIDSVGNVGIGTIAPQFRLQVSSNDAQNAGHRLGIMIENTAAGDGNTGEAAINFRNAGPAGTGDNYWMVGLNQNRNFAFAYGNDFNQGATNTVIDSTGRMGLGVINPTERLDVNGNIRLNGEVNRDNGVANMVPLCYGVGDGNGGLAAANSGNFTMAKIGTGQYEVTIPGENYVSANYVTVATAAFITPAIVTTFSSNGKLRIYIFDLAGNPKDNFFTFVVYKP